MPFPPEDQRHVITTLAPRQGKKNPYGNGQLFPIFFDWVGPVVASESNHLPLPFEYRVQLVQVSYTVAGGAVSVVVHGLGHPVLEGPHVGESYVLAPDDAESIPSGTRLWAEALGDNPSVEGITVLVVGSPVM